VARPKPRIWRQRGPGRGIRRRRVPGSRLRGPGCRHAGGHGPPLLQATATAGAEEEPAAQEARGVEEGAAAHVARGAEEGRGGKEERGREEEAGGGGCWRQEREVRET